MVFRVPHGAEWWFSLLFLGLDALIINLIFLTVFEYWLLGFPHKTTYLSAYFQVRYWLFGLFVVFGSVFDLFRLRSLRAASDILSSATATLLSAFVTFNLLVFFSRSLASLAFTFPRPIILLSTGLAIVGVFFTRILLTRMFRPFPRIVSAVVVGRESDGKRIITHFHKRGGVRFRVMGMFHKDQLDDLASFVIFRQIQEIIVTDPRIDLDAFWAAIYYQRKVEPHQFRVRVAFDPSTSIANIGLKSLEDLPMTTVSSLPLTATQRFLKRSFDIAFALFAIALTSPAMLIAAILVPWDSRGPIFYKQKRIGRYGKEFELIKYRSMHIGSERGGPKIAVHDDPRTTRVGRIIRRLAIDELPQFFLVLMGEMSVVGPRPERPFFVQKHSEFQGRRLAVRPGVTGLAAVNARYYLRLTDKVAYDYFYLDHYSIILDVKIIFQTIWVVLFESDKSVTNKPSSLEKNSHHSSEDDHEPPGKAES
jgi:exopolysaccharide biosynthesis polyprenyl glycosylphosphotransferase